MTYKIKQVYMFIVRLYRYLFDYPILLNVNKHDEKYFRKRALLIYLTKPFQLPEGHPKFLMHQNLKQCKQIADILGEVGYIVDVMDIKSKKKPKLQKYDLILSHLYNLSLSKTKVKDNCILIYFSSGMNHKINNVNIKNRSLRIKKSKGCILKIHEIQDTNMEFVKYAKYIIGFGNNYILSTWNKDFNAVVYPFNNYGLKINYSPKRKLGEAKKKFLFFASGSQIRKGLDILLEIFPKFPDLELYVCSSFKNETDFCRCYHKELFETPNIHPVGWVRIDSEQFRDVLNQCAYVVLPSCSEGQAGSVVQCMHAGLIPVVTKEVGIDTENFGVTFKNDSLQEIEQTILDLSAKPVEWVQEKSEATLKASREKFSEQAFINRWREILKEILKKESVL